MVDTEHAQMWLLLESELYLGYSHLSPKNDGLHCILFRCPVGGAELGSTTKEEGHPGECSLNSQAI